MIFRPFYYFDTGCAAYVFGCGSLGKGAVVDPQERDLDSYVSFAEAKGLKITHVIETHVHADHRSGGRAFGGVLLGLGTAMVYPTLLAAIGDVAHGFNDAMALCGGTNAWLSAHQEKKEKPDEPRALHPQ